MDAAGRATKTQTTSTIPGSTARPAVYTHYDPATGQADYTGPLDQTSGQGSPLTDAEKTTVYDGWGRATTTRAEAPGGGYDTTTTSYDTAGRVATVTDPKGTTTTTWDGTDALGDTERRGRATKVTVTRTGPDGGGGTVDFTGAYDADGALTVQRLPGGITQVTTLDEAGEPVGLAYDGQVTPVTQRLDGNGDPVFDGNGDPVYDTGTPTRGTWLAWSQDNDITGRVRAEYTGAGSSFDPGTSGATSLDQVVAGTGDAFGYDRGYGYDGAGRLVTVTDRTATATGMVLDPGTAATAGAPCTVRAYTFDDNGRRTQLVTDTHRDGECTATPTGTATATHAYDTADRPTTGVNGSGVYAYDGFGRQTLIPAADAPQAGGDITLGYDDDDLARTITQGGVTTTLALDSGGRRSTVTTTGGTAGTSTLERHYTDGSDNPAWTVRTGSAGAVTTRYAESLAGDLAASITTDGAITLPLATLHGDVVTTVPIPATTTSADPATGIAWWSDYTEYGTPRDPASAGKVAGTVGYGWLGAKQRSTSTDTAGLTLMGDRLYNPVTGTFTATDPEPGGNPNAYTYPTDPINMFDLDGHFGWGWVKTAVQWGSGNSRGARIFRSACGWTPGWVGTACSGYLAGSYASRGNRSQAVMWGVSAATSWVGGGLVARGFRSTHAFGHLASSSRYVGRHTSMNIYQRGIRRASSHFTRQNLGYRATTYWSANLHGSAATVGVQTYGHRRRWWD
ncbi:MAG TPA: RHS repeat-associated core domain-containing protein [Dermatophilaceae bacterium]|nr:RHS repeat-associated core domain-containing protein [Dermatophilaceae bacterium]